jgi:glycosyltransferase involved in cell wall biosynthesis
MLEFSRKTEIAPPTSPMIPVSVTMIVKDCATTLKDTLSSINRNFLRDCDEIVVLDTGSSDDTVSVAQSYGARVIDGSHLRQPILEYVEKWLPEDKKFLSQNDQLKNGCILDFAEARQYVTDRAKNDVQLWIDSDDVLEEQTPGQLRDLVNKHMGVLDAIFVHYAYAFDPSDGKLTTILKRERVFNRTRFVWKGKCHETCIPREGVKLSGSGWFSDYAGAIVHKHGRRDHRFGDLRNYIIIRKEIEADFAAGKKPDLRSVFYLGNACRGLDRLTEAIECYDKIIAGSGSRDDAFAAAYYVATAYLRPSVQRPVDSLDYGFKALRIDPSDPRACFVICHAYQLLGRFENAIHFYKMGQQLPEPVNSLHSYDPEHIRSLPHSVAAFCYKELGDEEGCRAALTKLQDARPNHPDTIALTEHLSTWYAGRKLLDSVKTVAANRRPKDQKDAGRLLREVLSTLPEIPQEAEEAGMGRIEPLDERPGNDLVFFCGPTHERWGPVNRKTGIGGSEKAVLEMSKRLQKRGFRVTVYASVPSEQRGLDDAGVLWRHFSEFNYETPRGTVIFWRNPAGAIAPIPCLKRIVWCHDVQDPNRWTPEICAAVDEVWVLSKFHASTLGAARHMLGNKLVVTRNGIDSELFHAASLKGLERKPNRVVYSSSPDRGVITAIKAFQEAFKNDVTAELHVFYGFTRHFLKQAARYEYGHVPDTNQDENMYSYMQRVMRYADADDRIKWRGRVGPEQLAEELTKSGVWFYPTRFDEISCMSAMEAQAAGCMVVATDKAALAETIDWNAENTRKVVLGPDIADTLLAGSLASLDRDIPAKVARDRFSYETLADEWARRISSTN